MKPEEVALNVIGLPSRPPCGGRGLKLNLPFGVGNNCTSPPVRGAWIETFLPEMLKQLRKRSPPVRGAWIETPRSGIRCPSIIVAPRAGGVD